MYNRYPEPIPDAASHNSHDALLSPLCTFLWICIADIRACPCQVLLLLVISISPMYRTYGCLFLCTLVQIGVLPVSYLPPDCRAGNRTRVLQLRTLTSCHCSTLLYFCIIKAPDFRQMLLSYSLFTLPINSCIIFDICPA